MRRIVIIEDDETIVDLMTESFLEAGVDAEWRVVRTGTDGMRWAERVLLESPIPDLLILDLNLPAFSGLEILARLRSRALPPFPIVVMSGSPQPRDRTAALAGGATMFLPKPDDLDACFALGRLLRDLMEAGATGSAPRAAAPPAACAAPIDPR